MAQLMMEGVFYRYPGTKKDILKGVDAQFVPGRVTAIVGRSGAGKSTTTYLLAGLDVPSQGRILYNGKALQRNMLDSYRRNEAATIAQSYLLFPTRTALENVLYPFQLAKTPEAEALEKAKEYLHAVGIPEELYHRLPNRLSGGEQQRVAIARALANNPRYIIADEPTGNIDPKMSIEIMNLLMKINKLGKTVIVVTHEKGLVDYYQQRVIKLKDGKIIDDRVGGMFK